jgi:tetratricopeptide (TPR) repeat protein
VKRSVFLVSVLVLTAVAAAFVLQTMARERDYRALLAHGDAFLRDQETFGAIEAYSGAIALRPDSMLAHLRRGETYQRRGDFQAASRDFRAAADLDSAATRPWEELGDVLSQLQRYRRSAEAYEACLRIDDRSGRVSYKLALARYKAGDIDQALVAVNQAIRVTDNAADAYFLLGLCLRDRRRVADAQQALAKAIALSPGFIPAREELADLYRDLGRSADELEQLQVLAVLDRDRVERQVAVGLAHARAGHADLAILTLGNALERIPNQPFIYEALGEVWLGTAEAQNDRGELAKALEALSHAAASDTATSQTLTLYGRALLQNDQPRLAEDVLKRATERYPVEPSAFLHYATAAERQSDLGSARQALIAYRALLTDIDRETERAALAARIGTLSVALDEPTVAIAWLNRALAATPNDVQLLTSLAEAQLKADDRPAALATIARALEKDPTNPAIQALAKRAR